MKSKKAQYANLNPWLMGIIGAAVVLAIGLLVLQEFNAGILTDISATSVVNESVTWVNATQVAFAQTDCPAFTCGTIYENATKNTTLGSGNYSCGAGGLTVTDISDDTYNITSTVLANYECKIPTAAYNATRSNITKIATMPTWIGILITVGLAFLVLGYFYKRR